MFWSLWYNVILQETWWEIKKRSKADGCNLHVGCAVDCFRVRLKYSRSLMQVSTSFSFLFPVTET